ncbi:30S ribosomal protein S2 [Candidatus Woesebacteria bacterium RBG_19FT_COMBO_47_8]|uniref:Small ribosomal subunit protein uS2 n=1 Tax=Candidatus Woesebacteria bacterium RBG_13_46_13 TaxID=1802479 RepID=A0A1F7X4D5_9BACT|nr:MAG: 30S ribosomal protein S2 [Candidatus Woesebacteria bacterium RBG_13_46_13]OGM18040.1 MAG: 30S ribosomal protein S2 [Candidatus Woesebacteria bacterium RBG_19FT_COMBO_47_8]HJX59467.1 30S ribosomal protein S2 [Patescibacteria group bacterium]
MTSKISLEKLLEAGAHFGHQARRWNPKMSSYLYGVEEGIHIFDLPKTKIALEEALEVLTKASAEGKVILLLGTKKQVKDKIIEVGKETGCPYVSERWLGGTLSNFEQIKRTIDKLADMKVKMAAGDYAKFTKKERLLIERDIARMDRFLGGITQLEKLPDILFIVDTHKEKGAVREATKAKIGTVGIVDTNADPTLIDYPIPMNDDASKALDYVMDLVKDAIIAGQKKIKPVKEAK